jgi:hypothetical protein
MTNIIMMIMIDNDDDCIARGAGLDPSRCHEVIGRENCVGCVVSMLAIVK